MSSSDSHGTYTYADPFWNGDDEIGEDFDRWITALDKEVIQGEYGYEEGEFTVYPAHWWRLYNQQMTPAAAFLHALEAHREHAS